MNENPYASPTFTPEPEIHHLEMKPYATGWQRFGNLFIDNIVLQVVSTGAGFVLGMGMAAAEIAEHGTLTPEDEVQMNAIGFLLGLGISITYFTVCEAVFQRTVGKLVTGTKVVNEQGGRPTFGQVLGRTAARFIPFEAFSFLGQDAYGWHDSLSKTRVVKTR